MTLLETTIWTLGLFQLVQFLELTINFIYYTFIIKQKDLPSRYGKGSWVIISGGSHGIGFEFTRRFAELGFNVIMIARNLKNLQEKEAILNKQYPSIKVESISADLSQGKNLEFYEKNIYQHCAGKDISIIVNNVGIMFGMLDQNSEEEINDCMNINTYPVMMMTKRFIEAFKARPQRSAVINVGSQLSCFPFPSNSIYGSTKSAVYYFSESLANDQKLKEKVDVTLLHPGYCKTRMMNNKGNLMFGSTPEGTVEGAIRNLGNSWYTNGDIHHILGQYIIGFFQILLISWIVMAINDFVCFAVLGFRRKSKTLLDSPESRGRKMGLYEKFEFKMSNMFKYD